MNCDSWLVPKNSLMEATTGPDVDQRLRRDGLDVLRGHPLADDALHPGQAGADLVLDELADRAQAPVAEVVDVVHLDPDSTARRRGRRPSSSRRVQRDEEADGRDDVLDRQDAGRERLLEASFLLIL
jgi:hypothetical protein